MPQLTPTRRQFLATATATAAAATLASRSLTALADDAKPPRRRYAIIGTGGRGIGMWGTPIVKQYGDVIELVGLCDINPKRVEIAKQTIGVDCPTFTDFSKMCDTVKPELLTITTVDGFHSKYIVEALDRGIDVITEKPMVINEKQCREVLDAEKRNNRKITVGFNYRYAPKHVQIKELIQSGAIGKILSVDFNWYLNTSHGAAYFRRWHRLRKNSGSLLVHKATHHFDLVNWWMDAEPVEVMAHGDLKVYGKSGPFRHTHCRTCPHQKECKFYWDITKSPGDMKLYVAAEDVDGYLRDGCVFREDIDIFDTMSASVTYSNGAMMTYSLNAYLPIEGYRIAFNGERGRLEVRDFDQQPWKVEGNEMALVHLFGEREIIQQATGVGGHGGGDQVITDQIFRKTEVAPHLKLPTSRAGAMSCLTGIAARKSIDEKRPIKISELLPEA